MRSRFWVQTPDGEFIILKDCEDFSNNNGSVYLSARCNSCGSKILLPLSVAAIIQWDGLDKDGNMIGGNGGMMFFDGACPVCHHKIHFSSDFSCRYPENNEAPKVSLSNVEMDGCKVISVGKVNGFLVVKQ